VKPGVLQEPQKYANLIFKIGIKTGVQSFSGLKKNLVSYCHFFLSMVFQNRNSTKGRIKMNDDPLIEYFTAPVPTKKLTH